MVFNRLTIEYGTCRCDTLPYSAAGVQSINGWRCLRFVCLAVSLVQPSYRAGRYRLPGTWHRAASAHGPCSGVPSMHAQMASGDKPVQRAKRHRRPLPCPLPGTRSQPAADTPNRHRPDHGAVTSRISGPGSVPRASRWARGLIHGSRDLGHGQLHLRGGAVGHRRRVVPAGGRQAVALTARSASRNSSAPGSPGYRSCSSLSNPPRPSVAVVGTSGGYRRRIGRSAHPRRRCI